MEMLQPEQIIQIKPQIHCINCRYTQLEELATNEKYNTIKCILFYHEIYITIDRSCIFPVSRNKDGNVLFSRPQDFGEFLKSLLIFKLYLKFTGKKTATRGIDHTRNSDIPLQCHLQLINSLRKYNDTAYSKSIVNQMWNFKNSNDFLKIINPQFSLFFFIWKRQTNYTVYIHLGILGILTH